MAVEKKKMSFGSKIKSSVLTGDTGEISWGNTLVIIYIMSWYLASNFPLTYTITHRGGPISGLG